ncbi:uncharacterized protein LOC144887293 isoform X2 [Branchiostoma floridae x Branchiostoma japonicum]
MQKKALLGAFSSRLHASYQDLNHGGNRQWRYVVNETGHEGVHEAEYEGKNNGDTLVFKRQKFSHIVPNAETAHQKEIWYHKEKQVPTKIIIGEKFTAPRKVMTGYQAPNGIPVGFGESHMYESDDSFDLPEMHTFSNSQMELTDIVPFPEGLELPVDLVKSSLFIDEYPKKTYELDAKVQKDIVGNLTCMREIRPRYERKRMMCFEQLVNIVRHLEQGDVAKLADQYIQFPPKGKNGTENMEAIIDALGAAAVEESQIILTERILLRDPPDAELLKRMFSHFVNLEHPPAVMFFDALENFVFGTNPPSNHESDDEDIMAMATLVLGSLVGKLMSTDPVRGENIVARMEEELQHHDPVKHRAKRAAEMAEELKKEKEENYDQCDYNNKTYVDHHEQRKATLLLSLGNAGLDRSYNHILSYISTPDSPQLLKRSGAVAVAKYNHEHAASMLLKMAVDEGHEDHVRYDALLEYRRHPKAVPITDLHWHLVRGLTNITGLETNDRSRLKRGFLDDLLNFKFDFKLKLPGIEWKKMIGSEKVGASFGLTIRNIMDLSISLLKGHFKLDVLDEAYATAHFGIINYNLDIVRIRVCFRGGIKYDVNILKEFNFEEVFQTIITLDKVVDRIVGTIKSTVNNFKNLFNSASEFSFPRLIEKFADVFENLPKKIDGLIAIGQKTTVVLGEMVNPPAYLTAIVNVVRRVTGLMNDIKRDVTKFVDSISDAITITLPWAIEQIKEAVNMVVNTLKNFFANPIAALGDVQKAVIKIQNGIFKVLDAKNRIQKSCLFLKGQRPYWFDIKTVITEIWDEVLAAKDVLINSVKNLAKPDLSATKYNTAKRFKKFTGIGPKVIKKQLEDEVITAFGIFEGPLRVLQELAAPFVDTYELVVGKMRAVKAAYTFVKNAYTKARTLLSKIFGPKMHKDFPRKLLQATSCSGYGPYPSTGNGKYKHQGVDLELNKTSIKVPFTGILRINDSSAGLVSILVDDPDGIELIIQPITVPSSKNGMKVFKGESLGTAKTACGKSLHVAFRKAGTTDQYIDPMKYLEKRKPGFPKWNTECDDYRVVLLGITFVKGSLTKGPGNKNTTPARAPPPNTNDVTPISKRKKREASATQLALQANGPTLTAQLGLPPLSEIGPALSGFKDTKVAAVLKLLGKVGLTDLQKELQGALDMLEDLLGGGRCVASSTLDDGSLKLALKAKGLALNGSREAKLKRYRAPSAACPQHHPHIPGGVGCAFKDGCYHIRCCVELVFTVFRRVFEASLKLDPCTKILTLQVGAFQRTFNTSKVKIAEIYGGPIVANLDIHDPVVVSLGYLIMKPYRGTTVTFDLKVSMCGEMACIEWIEVFKQVTFDLTEATTACTNKEKAAPAAETKILDMAALKQKTMTEIKELVAIKNPGGFNIAALMTELRTAYLELVMEAMNNLLGKLFNGQFSSFDICMRGQKLYGPYDKQFFKIVFNFMVGPIPLSFEFASGGSWKITCGIQLCFMTMKAVGTATPQLGAYVSGELSINLFLFKAGLKLIGYLLTTKFPTKAEVGFSKFPLDVACRMDLELIPLRLELHVILKLTINLLFTTIEEVLIQELIWSYQTPTITANIFNTVSNEKDESPPQFKSVTTASSGGVARRAAVTSSCTVYQVKGRDYTEPAFQLAIAADDDKSEVTVTYSIGTFEGGSDLAQDNDLGGPSSIVDQVLPERIPLFFTVKATNSGGGSASATCSLDYYDLSPPAGRVNPDFVTTSNPNVLKASGMAVDETPLTERKEGVGFGRGIFGDQTFPWSEVQDPPARAIAKTSDPNAELVALTKFASPQLGKLMSTPFQVTEGYSSPGKCAADCLSFPPLKCYSFNYDYGESGRCELLEEAEGYGVLLHTIGHMHYFERLGIGKAVTFSHTDLELQHSQLYYFNYHLTNDLGYISILTSRPVKVDFTPVEPGIIQNESFDNTTKEPCHELLPDEWENRCIDEANLPNHRYIIDGDGSTTVFNGHTPFVDLLYTRANQYVSANWDGFHDNETGIFGYTWSAGTERCQDNIHPHKDPHSHLFDESEWTHTGIAHPLDLPDGKYYVNVRAVNKVEYGGPLATTVCHSRPYAIDNTEPFINEVHNMLYNDQTHVISSSYNVSDPLSGIELMHIGLGKSKRDTYILDWFLHEDTQFVNFTYKVEDGLPTWLRIRAVNHVDLRTTGHGPYPIMIDMTHPLAGEIYDGKSHGRQENYTATQGEYCSNWENFRDPDTGIADYLWGVGTSPGDDDVVAFKRLGHTVFLECDRSVNLTHNAKYYSTLFAFNRGHKRLNVSATTTGIMVDLTPPKGGYLEDGENPGEDLVFSSNPATVSAHWGNFSDPESGIQDYTIAVLRKPKNQAENEVIHNSESVGLLSSIRWHHFHLHQGDQVFVNLNVTNRALGVTSMLSNGFVLDLTPPKLYYLRDGLNPDKDMEYSSSTTQLTASFKFEDEETGVSYIELQVYQKYGGSKTSLLSNSVILEGSAQNWTSNATLNLFIGALYTVRVHAINPAGLTAVHETDGVLIDPTPPLLLYVHAGVLSGDEELTNGYVVITDAGILAASWQGVDGESGIDAYWVGLGTTSGGDDIVAFYNAGDGTDVILTELPIELTVDGAPIYYLSVKAQNGAGAYSVTLTSSPIKVVKADVAGLVFDGAGAIDLSAPTTDVNYQLEATTVSLQFEGYESAQHGIAGYEWGVGTSPGTDDIQPFTDVGILASEDTPGSGIAQIPLSLATSNRYYSSVRAITGAGNVLESTSDGFGVDQSAPSVLFTLVGEEDDDDSENEERQKRGTVYQGRNVGSLAAEWNITDDESAIAASWFAIGFTPASADLYNVTNTNKRTSIPAGLLTPPPDGIPSVVTVSAINFVGLVSTNVTPPVVFDGTPPERVDLACPKHISGEEPFTCSWDGIKDLESGVQHFIFTLGLNETDSSVVEPTTLYPPTTSISVRDLNERFRRHGTKLYATVIAVNGANIRSPSFSDAILVDTTPPVAGVVVEVNDNVTKELCTTGDECLASDVKCQTSVDHVHIAWEPFSDPDSDITWYEIAIGTDQGKADLRDFTKVPPGMTYYVFHPIDLMSVSKVYAIVRGYNGAGRFAIAQSNGVYISRLSAGLEPLEPQFVHDGKMPGIDMDFTDTTDELSARWSFGDPCPMVHYNWSIHRMDGVVVQPPATLPGDQTLGENSNIKAKDGESFFVVVRATNQLGDNFVQRSNGIRVKLEPLRPGIVRDGAIPGMDLNYQPSNTTLSANWDQFGNDIFVPEVANGNERNELETNRHQTIAYYEVAVGTDRRYVSTRSNVYPFTSVGKNRTVTLTDLPMISDGTYYITVRAFSVAYTRAQVTSNGIKVGVYSEVLSHGTVNLPRFISSTTTLTFSWDGFEFTLPLSYYYWGMGTVEFNKEKENITCFEMHDFDEGSTFISPYASYFDLFPFRNDRKNMMVNLVNLTLENRMTYYVTVMAADESLQCDVITLPVTVDTTPPKKGHVDVGPFINIPLQYTNRSDEMWVSWDGFYDDESDIFEYKVTVLGPERCRNMADSAPQFTDAIFVNATYSNYTFVDLALQEKVVYFVELTAVNYASGFTTITSSPVLTDGRDPIPGTVMDGDSFQRDISHQSSLTELHGTFTMYHGLEPYQCSYNHHDLDGPTEEWKAITAQGVWGTSIDASRIRFVPEQVSFEEDEGLTVTMVRDVRAERMISGGYMTVLNNDGSGIFQIEMVAATNESDAMTSLVFWDGPDGVVGGFDMPDIPEENDDDNATTSAPTTTRATTQNPFQVVNEESDELSGEKAALRSLPYTSLGMDIFAEWLTTENRTEYYALIWCRILNEPGALQFEKIELGFDASEAWHTYALKYIVDRTDATQELWGLELHVDGVYVTTVTGIPAPTPTTMMILAVRSKHGAVAEFQDVQNPPSVQAHFRNLKTPPSINQLCRYGTPFQDGSTTILKMYAGVGRSKGADDVEPFFEIEDLCIPCKDRCSTYNCDVSCEVDHITLHHVYINNLNLSTYMDIIEDDNSTTSVPALYYITIKAESGSGRFVVSSSDGVYVDATPPVFEDLFHVDLDWSEDQPITTQGSNSTIAIRWEAYDLESKIVEYFWAIGTANYSTNIQDFVSVGLARTASNSELEGILQPHMTYYATVIAVNAAGLNTTITTTGVTVIEDTPKPDENATVGVEGCEDGLCPGARSSVGVALPEFKPEDGITGIYLSIGSTEEDEDIIPETRVGYNESGTVLVDNGQVFLNGRVVANISDLGDLSDPDAPKSDKFNMEPGRKMFVKVKACNSAHKCTVVDTQAITVSREGDEVAKANDKGEVTMSLSAPSSKRSAGAQGVSIVAAGVAPGDGLLAGMLNAEDEEEEYSSGASKTFTPFIVNPLKTKTQTERMLNGRLLDLQESFFISHLNDKPLSGPISIDVPINTELFPEGTLPALLFWNTDPQQWMDASRTCPPEYVSLYDEEKSLLSVKVCSTHPITEQSSKRRRRRSTNPRFFSGSSQFAVFSVDKTIRNSAPVITTPSTVTMVEDAGTLKAQLKAEDPEGDVLIFSLDTESEKVLTGHAVMSPDGMLQYTPCLHCYGQDEIDYIVREELTIQPEALEVRGTLTITVTSTNDDPDLVFLEDGANIVSVRGPIAYNPLQLLIMLDSQRDLMFWMYDVDEPDISDELEFQVTQPTYGSLMEVGEACKAVTFTSTSCEAGAISDLVTFSSGACTVCRPTNLNNTGSKGIDDVSWALTRFTYTATNESFMYSSLFGKDTFTLQGVDADGGVSKALPVDMLVLQTCMNGGTCVGPAEDPNCENPEVATDLSAYSCNCTAGYLGALCHLEFIPCQPPIAPEDGSYSPVINGTFINTDVVVFSCELGFYVKGESALMCQWDGTWNATIPTCEIVQCPTIPNPDNGAVVPPGPKFYDDLASIQCDDGYWLNGSSIPVLCQADGTWNGTVGNCPPVPCPTAGITPGNGTMIPPGLKYFPDVATFTCAEGFNLAGPSQISCTEEGTWSAEPPTCNPVPCPPLSAPPNGDVTLTGLGAFFMENATFTCTLGYVPDDEHILTCQANGTWTGSAPGCRIAICRNLTTPEHGTMVHDEELLYLAEARFTCPDPNHIMVGHSLITCQADETWSAPEPECKTCKQQFSLPGSNFHMYERRCYWFSRRRDKKKYEEAQSFCEGGGDGGLVTIKSAEENTFITGVLRGFRQRRNFWIGLDDNESEESFTWKDGTNLESGDYTNWKFPPRRHKKRDCVTIHRQGSYQWVLVHCDRARNGFICEMDDTKLN